VLFFYEDFLAAYDPKLRKESGVYYTPLEVVQCQVRLIDEILRKQFGKEMGFVEAGVATLDPAAGTGTYLLAYRLSLKRVKRKKAKARSKAVRVFDHKSAWIRMDGWAVCGCTASLFAGADKIQRRAARDRYRRVSDQHTGITPRETSRTAVVSSPDCAGA